MELRTIDSLCSLISSGGTPSRKHPDFYTDDLDGHLWVKSKELLDLSIADTEERITDEGLNRSSAKYFPADTVLIAMYGANVGQLGWLKCPATVNQAVCGLVVNKEIASSRFVFYALLQTREALAAKAQGAAQQNLNQGLIREFQIPLPPLPTQQKIAAILSAYDDLIENNLRRIKILEEMAQNLYREWFVKFRFPGHQHARFTDSPLGRIPEGWEIKKILEFGNVITGKTPSKANLDFFGEDVPFVKTPDMHGNTFILSVGERLSVAGAKSQANKTIPPNSLCVSCIGTIGVVSITTEECQTNQQINSVVLMKEHFREFLFLRLQGAKQALENLGATGATMGNVNKGKFESLEVIAPPDDLVYRYHKFAAPLFSKILVLSRKNTTLHRTRDLLLPKLISGELDVSELDITVPEEAEA